jgi:hypothetical protein
MQSTPEARLNALLPRWWDWLQNLATEGRLAAAAAEALQLSGLPESAQLLAAQLASQNRADLPPVELLPAEAMGGAMGADDRGRGVIDLDAALNPLDTPGDGGALFAEWLLGRGVTPRERSRLAMENDWGTAMVHGEPVHVERADITGTEGDDVLTGTADADRIQGLAGNDTLYGGEGNDQSCGDAGDDLIDSDPGSDTIDGGAGTDYYTINYSDSTSAMVIVFDPTTGNGSITIGSDVDTLTAIEGFIHPIYWLGGQFIGSRFDDVLLRSNFS